MEKSHVNPSHEKATYHDSPSTPTWMKVALIITALVGTALMAWATTGLILSNFPLGPGAAITTLTTGALLNLAVLLALCCKKQPPSSPSRGADFRSTKDHVLISVPSNQEPDPKAYWSKKPMRSEKPNLLDATQPDQLSLVKWPPLAYDGQDLGDMLDSFANQRIDILQIETDFLVSTVDSVIIDKIEKIHYKKLILVGPEAPPTAFKLPVTSKNTVIEAQKDPSPIDKKTIYFVQQAAKPVQQPKQESAHTTIAGSQAQILDKIAELQEKLPVLVVDLSQVFENEIAQIVTAASYKEPKKLFFLLSSTSKLGHNEINSCISNHLYINSEKTQNRIVGLSPEALLKYSNKANIRVFTVHKL